MNNTYDSLVQQTFDFPQEGFKLKDNYLQYNDVDIKALIDKHGTPLKLSYLPKIGMQIKISYFNRMALPLQMRMLVILNFTLTIMETWRWSHRRAMLKKVTKKY